MITNHDAHKLEPFYSSVRQKLQAHDKHRENQGMCGIFNAQRATGPEESTAVHAETSQWTKAPSSLIFHVDSDGDESTVKSHVTRLSRGERSDKCKWTTCIAGSK